MSRINAIVAASENMVIGKDNQLLWQIPSDLKYFKEKTLNSSVIMGKNTWESIPEKFRPLPKRNNFVLTSDPFYKAKGAVVVHDLFGLIEAFKNNGINDDVFIIGGSLIYNQTFHLLDRLYFTKVFGNYEGDSQIKNLADIDMVKISESEVKEENNTKFQFIIYEKVV
jgi:dihydrofolate reductase